MSIIRKCAKRLPAPLTKFLKHCLYRHQIMNGNFVSKEKEFNLLKNFISKGSKVIDIGANVGHYTLLLSELVGKEGRVIAFEPVPETFNLLTRNVTLKQAGNVTLINGAIWTSTDEVRLFTPGSNLYQSHISPSGSIYAMSFPLSVFLPKSWNLEFIKIDAEGCDEDIIKSLSEVIFLYRPLLMAEISGSLSSSLVKDMPNYSIKIIPGSHNAFFVPGEKLYLFDAY